MLLVDDVLFFPFKSILWVFREIYNAAVEEIAAESDSIRTELSQLYLALEEGLSARRPLTPESANCSTGSTPSRTAIQSMKTTRMKTWTNTKKPTRSRTNGTAKTHEDGTRMLFP